MCLLSFWLFHFLSAFSIVWHCMAFIFYFFFFSLLRFGLARNYFIFSWWLLWGLGFCALLSRSSRNAFDAKKKITKQEEKVGETTFQWMHGVSCGTIWDVEVECEAARRILYIELQLGVFWLRGGRLLLHEQSQISRRFRYISINTNR